MAATARREIDTGEEDIAAIAKQISDHAEAIYQTWKARGLAPTEILSCRPTPGVGLKLGDLRTKPKPEPKPEIKQRPDIRRELRPEIVRDQRPDARRDQRSEPRREHWQDPEGDTIEVTLPPDLVPERNGTTSTGAGARRADPAAMRLEVAREEERLLRALRTGGVVAERTAERPDVVPLVPSLVDYAKSRYQDRLDSGARKPSTGASGERRASLGSHVTEARSKFEARARRASSAGAGEPATAAGATPVRPFLTRGSVAERVLMFEKCPSEATLELAKRKSPAATTWRGPHDVINRAQFYNDYKCRVKNKARRITQSQQKTGGGPIDVPQLSVLEERLCGIIGPDKFVDLPVRQNPLQDYSETGVVTEQSQSPPTADVEFEVDSMEFFQVETITEINDVEQQSTCVSTSNIKNIEQQSTSTAISQNSRCPEPNIVASNSQDIDQPSTSRGSSKRQKQNSSHNQMKGDINDIEKTKNILADLEKARLELNEAQVKAMLERSKIENKKVEAINSLASAAWALVNILKQDSCEVRQNSYAASTPPKPSSAPAHTTLQRTVRGAANSGAPARVIPRFHFPKGRPPPPHQQDHALHKVQSAFATFPNSQVPRESFKHIVKACECPLYWKMPLFLATQQNLHAPVDGHKFIDFWRDMSSQCHDQASRFVHVLTRGKSHTLAPEDFVPLVQDVVDTHPGLSFLKEATEFHSRYVHTVIARIFYCVNRSWSGRISIPELRRSNLLQVIQLLEDEEDINQVTQYFSYEHFYVIYCKFWELDRDHDLFIDKHDLARHNDHALSSRMIERVLSGCVTRGNQNRLTPDGEPRMSYTEFVWFLLAEEDKTHPTAIEYWFRCMDVDGDGYISMYELEYFYEEQMQRMEAIGIETLPFSDCLCQMLDMVHPAEDGKITLSDLKRCKLTPIFFDTFFNLEKYLDHEQRDPFATQRDSDCEMSEWDRFAAEEYELLVAEEGGSDAQDQISYDETDEDCLSPNLDDVTNTEVVEDSSVEESTSEGRRDEGGRRAGAGAGGRDDPRGYVNLSSIYSIGGDKWVNQTVKNGYPEKKLPEKPVPPEKPVSLMMVNGKTDNRYAGFGNNSFLYSHVMNPRGKEPPPYTAATGALFDKEKGASAAGSVRSPATSPVNGVNKISDNYERAVAERLSPQREIARLNRSSLFSKVNTGVVASKVKKTKPRPDDEDDDYARDSDECSI